MQPYDRWTAISPLVARGLSDYEVASAAGVPRATVQRLRSRFQAGDGSRPPDVTRYNWNEIQQYYDAGNSWRELKERFGVTFRALQKAVARGCLSTGRTAEEATAIASGKGRFSRIISVDQRRAISVRQSTKNSGGRCKWFSVSGRFVQGTWERDFALKLDRCGVRWIRLNGREAAWPYWFDGKLRHYTPDFYLPEFCTWVEIKGHWWGNDRRKMEAVTEQYPERRIIIIGKDEFQRAVDPDAPLSVILSVNTVAQQLGT